MRVKYWEIIADTLKNAGWSLGWVSAVDSEGRTIWIADAHRGDGKRYVVRADRIVDRVSGTRIYTRERRRPALRGYLTVRRTVCGVMPCFSLYSICLARR